MEGELEPGKLTNAISKRGAPPPRPVQPIDATQDDLRSSDYDNRPLSGEFTPQKDLPRKKAVILGGGFAGVSLAIALEKLARVDVVLIDTKVCLYPFPTYHQILCYKII